MEDKKTQIPELEYKTILLSIMDAIDKYCRENNLQYYLVGGTLLGAVRHGGFIPWDDDIDIAMKREDYIAFCNSFNINRNDKFKVVCLNNTPNYYLPSAKVIDTRTSLLENAYQAIEIGAYIDVFPLDSFSSESYQEVCNIMARKSFSSKLHALKSMNVSSGRSVIKNAAIVMSRMLCWDSMNKIARIYEKQILSISNSHTNPSNPYIANMCGAWGMREITKAEYFDSAVELAFEGRKYYGPYDYDKYLRGIYGDYMTLPPEEKRVSHHDFKVYWK